MRAAPAGSGIRIDAPTTASAVELVRSLESLGAVGTVDGAGESWHVVIDSDSETTLNRVPGAVDRWLDLCRLSTTKVGFRGREYVMTPRWRDG